MKRRSALLDLPKRLSAVSLVELQTAEDLFGAPTPEHQKRLSAKLGDPRALLLTDQEESSWGTEHLFGQPRSRAAPLPSGSILDYAQVHEALEEQRRRDVSKHSKSPTVQSPTTSSRGGSSERDYEDKTWIVEAPVYGNGGLANAVNAAILTGSIGDVCFIGTLGFPTDALNANTKEQIRDHLINEHQSDPVFVTDKDLNGHLSHYCKTILGPMLHYHVPDHPKSKAYADHSWDFYRNVNQSFADKVVAAYKRGDMIWIHDYHLMLAPSMIRKKLPDAQIGFFLHTAFPSSEIFRCLAHRKDLLEGMLGASLVAFQIDEYVQHFLQTCSRLLTVETTSEGVQLDDRFVNVTSRPVGINPAALQVAREMNDVQDWIKSVQKKHKGKKIIVARDRLDGIHGIRQKLLGYEQFLNMNPELSKQTVLIQVATSSEEDSELLVKVYDIITRIDRAYGDVTHQPIVFLRQDIVFSQYLALLTIADAFITTSLRDGMGLNAHEYIFCQDGKGSAAKKHGPLLLSEFAGSATILHGHLPVNPWDYKRMANSIKQALEMNDEEKEQRWKSLYSAVLRNNGSEWVHYLNKTLVKVSKEQSRRDSAAVPRLSVPNLIKAYEGADRRLLLIDYEGTLTPNKTSSGVAIGQPIRIIDTLNELLADPRNTVYVMSGMQPNELEIPFHAADGLGLVAENGGYLREHGTGSKIWHISVNPVDVQHWKEHVKGILKYYNERMTEATVEERPFSLIFHYGQVENQEAATRQAGDCAGQINEACKALGVQAVPVSKALVIEQTNLNKAVACKSVFEAWSDPTLGGIGFTLASDLPDLDFMLVAGNDREDEAVFKWANQLATQGAVRDVFTISVGSRNTEATSSLPQGSTGLITTLQKLARVSLDHM